jgi:hypothetical protein
MKPLNWQKKYATMKTAPLSTACVGDIGQARKNSYPKANVT